MDLSFCWRLLMVGGMSAALNACITIEPPPTPTIRPPTATATATIPFPTLVPTPTWTPLPSPTSTPDLQDGLGPPLYADPFVENLGWDLGERSFGGASIVGERIAIAVRQPGASLLLRSPAPASRDFLLEVRVRPELCRNDDEFGVVFRLTRSEEHYRFTLTCDGGARVRRVLSDGSRALIPFSASPAIVPGPLAENRIGVRAVGPELEFVINGAPVFSARDTALIEGGVGLFVRSGRSGQTTVLFDDLILRPVLATPTPSPTATRTPPD